MVLDEIESDPGTFDGNAVNSSENTFRQITLYRIVRYT